MSADDLKAALLAERHAAYGRLRGGFPILLAGATYWAALAVVGALAEPRFWYPVALFGSGTIFPLAVLWARAFRNPFLKDRSAVTSVLFPTFVAMLLFWPMAIASLSEGRELFPLILAIGLSLHFPVIGWSYGRTTILTAHAVLRAAAVTAAWYVLPDQRLVAIPLIVVAAYLLTALVIVVDSRRFRPRELAGGPAAA